MTNLRFYVNAHSMVRLNPCEKTKLNEHVRSAHALHFAEASHRVVFKLLSAVWQRPVRTKRNCGQVLTVVATSLADIKIQLV